MSLLNAAISRLMHMPVILTYLVVLHYQFKSTLHSVGVRVPLGGNRQAKAPPEEHGTLWRYESLSHNFLGGYVGWRPHLRSVLFMKRNSWSRCFIGLCLRCTVNLRCSCPFGRGYCWYTFFYILNSYIIAYAELWKSSQLDPLLKMSWNEQASELTLNSFLVGPGTFLHKLYSQGTFNI